jgi:hypothetical protein
MYATIGGRPVASALVVVPSRGPWWADVDLELDDEVAGRTTLALGALELSGTVRASENGAHGLQRRLRLVAGADGWGTRLAPKAYHADNGVRARTLAEDAAREAGEELGTFEPAAERVGIDYVRQAGPASRCLEDALGGVPWYVDTDGVTNVGERPSSSPPASAYEVLGYDPRARVVTLAVDELDTITVGATISERLEESLVVRELEIAAGPDGVRLRAWCGEDAGYGRIGDALRGFVRRVVDDRYFGISKYRVIRMSSDRVELQAVRRGGDMPDILPISMWPGVAGAHADLTPGAEVLVQFIDGERTQPIVTHFAGKDGNGWTPANVTIDATTLIKLGANASSFVALGDESDSRIDNLRQQLNNHTHTVAGGATSVPVAPVVPYATVKATKVKAE